MENRLTNKGSKKYSFVEFLAAQDSRDFDKIEIDKLEHWNKYLPNLLLDRQNHEGDCTREPFSCILCTLETLLSDYKEYYFNEEKYREDNQI